MKKILVSLLGTLLSASLFAGSPGKHAPAPSTAPGFHAEKITVYRNGMDCFIKSYYSREKDIVIRIFNYANESSFLVPKGSDIRKCGEYFMLHRNEDDYPATVLNSYHALSGNHGSIFLKKVGIPNHGFTKKDIGKALRDAKGNIWRIVNTFSMPSGDDLLIHAENRGTTGKPYFPFSPGKILYRPDGSPMRLFYERTVQMYPLNRIREFKYLIDGKEPLPDRTVRECTFLEHRFTHDVLAPGEAVKFLAENAGKRDLDIFSNKWGMMLAERAPEGYNKIPALFSVENRFRYQIRGAQVLERTTTFHAKGLAGRQLEQMFGWFGGILPRNSKGRYDADSVEEFYIPKLKKLQIGESGNPKKKSSYDFSRIFAMPAVLNVDYVIKRSDCLDPNDPPDRFVYMSGRGKREYGIVLGYSLFDGCTAKGEKKVEREKLYHFYKTKKMYPWAYQFKDTTPGTRIRSVSYKQYFDPNADPDIPIMYLHKEKDSWVLYMDFFKKMTGKTVKLPDFLTGLHITILEKTPSVIPQFGKIAGKEGLTFQVRENYGYLVLKFDKK